MLTPLAYPDTRSEVADVEHSTLPSTAQYLFDLLGKEVVAYVGRVVAVMMFLLRRTGLWNNDMC
jgi:hypothetical protein